MGKKLIVFGTNNEYHKCKKDWLDKNRVSFFIDNDKKKWDTVLDGLLIKNPDSLKNEDPNDIVVLIAHQYIFEAENQLLSLGINNYYSSLLFLERYSYGEHSDVTTIILN
jgi:hypothetical protein